MKFQSKHKIAGLPPFDMHRAFNYRFMLRDLNQSPKYKFTRFLSDTRDWLRALVFAENDMQFQISPNSKILFLLASAGYNRSDGRKAFLQVADTIGQRNYDFISYVKQHVFKPKRTLILLKLQVQWLITLRKEGYGLRQAMTVLPLLIEIWDKTSYLISNIKLNKYNLCVLLYDANCIDNYFSQLFQNAGVTTVTLQHGVMLSERKEFKGNPDFCGLELKNFVSSYFLAWNEFTKREAVRSGIPEERIKVLGVTKCLDNTKITQEKNHTIGLLLDGEFEAENNYNLITIVGKFVSKYRYKVVLRFHPRMNTSIYEGLYDRALFSICSKSIPLKEFVAHTEFCIAANSTAFIEMMCWGATVYRYSSRNAKDKYRDVKYPSFHTLQELESLYDKGIENIAIDSKELIGYINPREKYEDFFMSFTK